MQSVFTLVHYRYFLNGRIETGYWQSEKKYELIIWATNFSQEHAISRRKVGEKTNIITLSQIWVQSKLTNNLGKGTEAKSTTYKSNKNQANLSLFFSGWRPAKINSISLPLMFDKHELGQFLCVRTTFPVICSLCCRFCQVCTCEFISVWCKSGWQPWSEVDTVIVRVPCPSCVSKWSWTSLRNRSFKSMHLTTLLIRARLCYPSASVVAELSRKSQAQHRLLNEGICLFKVMSIQRWVLSPGSELSLLKAMTYTWVVSVWKHVRQQ